MIEETDAEGTWIAEGETWFPDPMALCKRLKAEYISIHEGDVYVGIPGKGEVPLADMLKDEARIKPAREGKVVPIVHPDPATAP